ncbi:MAG: hypothetical protein SVX43_19835, partial [Cyanobacteriota bacterium]|nr:hypothetical protein [Cyanobacteriota bacterium]
MFVLSKVSFRDRKTRDTRPVLRWTAFLCYNRLRELSTVSVHLARIWQVVHLKKSTVGHTGTWVNDSNAWGDMT